MPAGSNGSAINDAGDQAHFLVSTSSQNLVYPFRLPNGGAWQQLAGGTGHLTRYAMGSITEASDVSFTALGTGMVAPGPSGAGRALAGLLSSAYNGAEVTDAGRINASGQILAQVMIGRSPRLAKLTPAAACTADCLVSTAVAVAANGPAYCYDATSNPVKATASVTVSDESGATLGNAQVYGRFLDDYWTDRAVTGTTDNNGTVRFSYTGPCGTGAIAFLVDRATLGTRAFDRTRGVVTAWAIPNTSNQPPVASPSVSCSNRVCTFDGTASSDPDGTIATYRWVARSGWALSGARVTHTYASAGTDAVTLTVTDNAGASASKRVSFRIR